MGFVHNLNEAVASSKAGSSTAGVLWLLYCSGVLLQLLLLLMHCVLDLHMCLLVVYLPILQLNINHL